MAADGVLFVGFGGPTRPEEVRPYLRNVVRGRPVPPERLEEVAHQYELIGGRSPYNEVTFAQARAVESALREAGYPMPCAVGMRNWAPYLKEAVESLHDQGCRRAVGVILAPHRSETSWERYQQNVSDALQEAGLSGQLAVTYIDPWYDHPLFLEAVAQRLEEATGYSRGRWPEGVPVLFTAHSIPLSMARESRYVEELETSARGVAGLLELPDWSLVYQSRSGPPQQPWLEPDIGEVLPRKAADGVREVAVVPLGFLSCHVEVLYDLDVKARAAADSVGLRLTRARTVEDHPLFARMLAQRIIEAAQRPDPASTGGP